MKKSNNYNYTVWACRLGYMVQAITVNFIPLLFVRFSSEFGINLGKLSLIPVVFFMAQFSTDLFCTKFADLIGYRPCIIGSEVLTVLGLVGLTFIPNLINKPLIGILVCVFVYGIGSGLTEVLYSPIVEALPIPNKDRIISGLSAAYAFGSVGTILVSTLFYLTIGIENWRVLAIIWAIFPAFNIYNFSVCPLVTSKQEKIAQNSLSILKEPLFLAFVLMMICAGAIEASMSQWASAYTETALNLSKTWGDVAGPCAFSAMLGFSRYLDTKQGTLNKLPLFLFLSGILCLICFILASISSIPVLGLIGCMFCGFAVGMLWPGGINISAVHFPKGGTAMYAYLAMAGDLGSAIGPGIIGKISEQCGDNLSIGMRVGCIFPLLFIILMLLCRKKLENTD